jgi:hypothetical protein
MKLPSNCPIINCVPVNESRRCCNTRLTWYQKRVVRASLQLQSRANFSALLAEWYEDVSLGKTCCRMPYHTIMQNNQIIIDLHYIRHETCNDQLSSVTMRHNMKGATLTTIERPSILPLYKIRSCSSMLMSNTNALAA